MNKLKKLNCLKNVPMNLKERFILVFKGEVSIIYQNIQFQRNEKYKKFREEKSFMNSKSWTLKSLSLINAQANESFTVY